MTSSTVRWSVHMPSMGYLCLALALLVHSSRQSPVLDLGYTDDRDLGHSDVRELGYTDVRDRQLHEGSRMKRLLKISKQLQLEKASSSRPAHTERGTKLSNSMVEELARGVTLLLEALADPPTRRAQTSKNGTTWLKRKAKRDPDPAVYAVRTKFTEFHKSLTTFCNELPDKLVPDAPAGLQDVAALTTIMTPEDHVFSDDNVQLFTEKYFTIQQLLYAVLDYTRQFLKNGTTEWYWDNFMALNTQTGSVKFELDNWQTHGGISGNSGNVVLDAGVGGVNSGVRNDMDQIDRKKLGNLINALNTLINAN